jgi:hypothetical protein
MSFAVLPWDMGTIAMSLLAPDVAPDEEQAASTLTASAITTAQYTALILRRIKGRGMGILR